MLISQTILDFLTKDDWDHTTPSATVINLLLRNIRACHYILSTLVSFSDALRCENTIILR